MEPKATFAPPSLSGRCPNARRPTINTTLNAVNASQTCAHPFFANKSATNVVTAPNPTLLNARPRPGIQTARAVRANCGSGCGVGATDLTGATNTRLANGSAIVAHAMA